MKRELAEVKIERDFKKVCDVFRQGGAMRYGLIESMRRKYPIALMYRVLDVSESGFHARRARPPCERVRENTRLKIEILSAHQRTRETYSAMRLPRDLADHVMILPQLVKTWFCRRYGE